MKSIYREKRRGLRIEPWDIPKLRVCRDEKDSAGRLRRKNQ